MIEKHMNILVLGGTGAMGVPLVNLLNKAGHNVYVTSRRQKQSKENIHYIQGDAKDKEFLNSLLEKKYDSIIDFMVYTTEELSDRIDKLLNSTNQYFFFSSSRVYAQSETPTTEESPRLLDVCKDREYLKTNEYALTKAREEDILRANEKNNWTIIRPYITYNTQRLQLGAFEKENWLYRALNGRTIVFPKDIANSTTSLTYGPDVAEVIVKLIGKKEAYGQAFHIVTEQSVTWDEVLNIYFDVIEKRMGVRPKVKYIENSDSLQKIWNKYQIKYDRLFKRVFDNSKISRVAGKIEYKDLKNGLTECLEEFLSDPHWGSLHCGGEAWADKISGEKTPLNELGGAKNKVIYLMYRFIY